DVADPRQCRALPDPEPRRPTDGHPELLAALVGAVLQHRDTDAQREVSWGDGHALCDAVDVLSDLRRGGPGPQEDARRASGLLVQPDGGGRGATLASTGDRDRRRRRGESGPAVLVEGVEAVAAATGATD